jgi:hypothetical protein
MEKITIMTSENVKIAHQNMIDAINEAYQNNKIDSDSYFCKLASENKYYKKFLLLFINGIQQQNFNLFRISGMVQSIKRNSGLQLCLKLTHQCRCIRPLFTCRDDNTQTV